MENIEKIKQTIRMENVVVSAGIGSKLDLNQIVKVLENANYNKKRFPGVVHRIMSPKVTMLIFGSGKFVCTGARTIEDARVGLSKVFEKLEETGISIQKDFDINTHNIVATADIGRVLNLHTIAIGLGLENIEYEPEQFPGLVYRLKGKKVVALLFSSGKIVITGGKSVEDVETAVDKIIVELNGLGLL